MSPAGAIYQGLLVRTLTWTVQLNGCFLGEKTSLKELMTNRRALMNVKPMISSS